MKLLKFYSTTCIPCKQQGEILKQVKGIEVQDIDIEEDENIELISNYKVRNVPMLVLLDENEDPLRVFRGVTKANDIQTVVDFYTKTTTRENK